MFKQEPIFCKTPFENSFVAAALPSEARKLILRCATRQTSVTPLSWMHSGAPPPIYADFTCASALFMCLRACVAASWMFLAELLGTRMPILLKEPATAPESHALVGEVTQPLASALGKMFSAAPATSWKQRTPSRNKQKQWGPDTVVCFPSRYSQ